jgi:adenylate cyclase
MTCTVRFRTRREGSSVQNLEVPRGTTLLEAAQRAGLPIARACAGGGLCGRCGLEVLAGAEALASPGAAEERAKQRNRVPAELRLACQVEVCGPLEVTAAYW